MKNTGTRIFEMTLLAAALGLVDCATVAEAADVFNGKDVYELHCQGCHGSDGRSMEPGTPDFTRGESLFVPDSDLVQRLRDGVGMMPAYRGMLEDADLRDVVAYIRTLQR